MRFINSSKFLHDPRLAINKHVQKLSVGIISDLHHRQLIVSTESRAENGCRNAHFLLLKVSCLHRLATKQLEDGLEVCIGHKRRHSAKLVVIKFDLRLFGAWRIKSMKNRYEIVTGAKHFVAHKAFFTLKMTETAKANIFVVFIVVLYL